MSSDPCYHMNYGYLGLHMAAWLLCPNVCADMGCALSRTLASAYDAHTATM